MRDSGESWMPSLASVGSRQLELQLIEDFQNFLAARTNRPSVVFWIAEDGSVRSRFPAPSALHTDFFRLLLQEASKQRPRARVEAAEQRTATGLLRNWENAPASPTWHISTNGLEDIYIPLYLRDSLDRPNIPSAALVFGRYLVDSKRLTTWITEITTPGSLSFLFPGRSAADLQVLRTKLIEAAKQIPALPATARETITTHVSSAAILLRYLAAGTAKVSKVSEGEQLIADLGPLVAPRRHLLQHELWSTVADALAVVVNRLSLGPFALYSGRDGDFHDMRAQARSSRNRAATPSDTLALRSREEFHSIESLPWLQVPNNDSALNWLDPRTYIGTNRALLFASEMAGQHLVLLFMGLPDDRDVSPQERTILYDVVTSRIFPFINTSLIGIEMDYFMEETGHLLTRAVAAVKNGARALTSARAHLQPPESTSAETMADKGAELAAWALEDGATRLEMISQNFTFFRLRRIDITSLAEDEQTALANTMELVDVSALLLGMKDYFEKAARYSEREPGLYAIAPCAYPVVGSAEVLRVTLLNLFDNALKFSYKGTYITYEVAYSPDHCIVSISNLGLGVPIVEQNLVFQPRRRGSFRDPSVKRPGLGLGLSYCAWAVEVVFGGTISLRSRAVRARRRVSFEGDNWVTQVTMELPRARSTGEEVEV